MKEYAEKFYKSQAWKRCRGEYAKTARGLCERCLARGLYRPGEIVHHIRHVSPETINDPAVLLNWDNLELVCRACHAELHSGREGARVTLDEYGRVIF